MPEGRIFKLQQYTRSREDFSTHVVITPQTVPSEKVIAAWSYAIRHTATGIDLPDYERALQLMKERHPSWNIIESDTYNVSVQLNLAEKDIPEK